MKYTHRNELDDDETNRSGHTGNVHCCVIDKTIRYLW